MDNHDIEAIIFDLGNVLIDFDHRSAAERISKFTDRTGKEIFDLFFDSELTGLFEEGKISPLQFFLKAKEMLNLKLDFDAFIPLWNEIFFFSEKNLGVYNLAVSLKRNYKVAVLSNINILHFEYIKKTFPILNTFPHFYASCELGLKKPQPLIYQRTLKLIGASAARTFYTDDRQELVESAKKLGINSFVFSSVGQLKNDFLSAGVNIN